MYRLYAKLDGDKTYIHASLFTKVEKETLERVDLAHPDNAGISFEFRKVKMC